MKNVTIIGAGMMGSAMTRPLLDNGFFVRLVGTPLDDAIIAGLKENGFHKTLKQEITGSVSFHYSDDIPETLKNTEFVICGVSSFGVEWFAGTVLPLLQPGTVVLAITKGLKADKDGTLIPFPLYLSSLRPDVSFNAVGGPCISFELGRRVHTEVAFCGQDKNILSKLRDALSTDYYHITITDDVRGIESAVALKNAYALGVSLAIGLYAGANEEGKEEYNAQAALFYEATREMKALIKKLGGREDAPAFGAGDLYVTVFGGRTRRLGVLLGSGKTMDEALDILSGVTLESVAITKVICKAFAQELDDYPLMKHIDCLLAGKQEPIPWDAFRQA